MKRFTPPIIFLAIISIALVYSCKKDIKQLFNDDVIDIDWAKTYYQDKLQNAQNDKLASIANTNKGTYK